MYFRTECCWYLQTLGIVLSIALLYYQRALYFDMEMFIIIVQSQEELSAQAHER